MSDTLSKWEPIHEEIILPAGHRLTVGHELNGAEINVRAHSDEHSWLLNVRVFENVPGPLGIQSWPPEAIQRARKLLDELEAKLK